jgi:hypothetical protein
MMRYDWAPGMPFLPKFGGGKSFPQVFCAPIDGRAPPLPMFTDDAVFAPQKKACFQIVALVDGIKQLEAAMEDVERLKARVDKGEVIDTDETTYLVHKQAGPVLVREPVLKLLEDKNSCVRILGAEEYEAAGGTEEARNIGFERPAPVGYDVEKIRKDLGRHVRYVIVRWDRMVFASCKNVEELLEAVGLVEGCLDGAAEVKKL